MLNRDILRHIATVIVSLFVVKGKGKGCGIDQWQYKQPDRQFEQRAVRFRCTQSDLHGYFICSLGKVMDGKLQHLK